jgi:hypothetical protein
MEVLGIFIVFIFIAIMIRLVAGSFDGERVETYIQERGWELVDKSWDPFGPGWFGEKDSRIYQIVYRDQDGNVHQAHVKTSMFSGVYLTNDRIVERAASAASAQEQANSALQDEVQRLRQRVAQLEEDLREQE